MVKSSHKTLRNIIAEQNWTQFALAEKLDVSDHQIRNLCKNDTDTRLSLCYKMSQVFGTTMEELLVIREIDE